jgi:uncharacterized phage protein (TIGR01671 family)
MNREIKFRAWDTIKNIFVDEGEITFYFYGDSHIEVHPNSITYIGDQVHNREPQRGRFIIQQYTGLEDKNGKEIYEGDIICWTINDKQKNQIVFHEGCFGHLNFTGINKEHREFIPINKTRAEYMIVCGNIYENPELLTKKNI